MRTFRIPWVTGVAEKKDPYRVLVSCILSLRTKDKTTAEASSRLFEAADNPSRMLALKKSRISRLIYPVGFYRNKARYVRELSVQIIDDFYGRVPDNLEDLLQLKGVGRKTANLVLGLGYGIPAICVDTHVHRISNRLGWVRTGTPEDTEPALMKLLPRRYWIELNTLLVAFGQHICLPVSPLCSLCRVSGLCPKKGVKQRR
ncbi:MAG: endonuclease III [Candidatus Omnitrophota bacterium]